MENKVKQLDETVYHDVIPRIEAVEKIQQQLITEVPQIKTDLAKVQTGQAELQLAVLKDGKETRKLLEPFAAHYLSDLDQQRQNEKDIKIKKMETREKIIVAVAGGLFGTGGLAAIILAVLGFMNN